MSAASQAAEDVQRGQDAEFRSLRDGYHDASILIAAIKAGFGDRDKLAREALDRVEATNDPIRLGAFARSMAKALKDAQP